MEEFPATNPIADDQGCSSSSNNNQQGTAPADPSDRSANAIGAVVHILMCYQVGGGDPDFVKKAIESLVKKLKDRREQLDTLISAVTSGGKQPTSCVTIPRSLDGRLQVAGRKGLPHVVYARIWRWPNVNKTEMLKLPVCGTPADHPDLICINSFHYDRIVSSGLSNLEVGSFRVDPLPIPASSDPSNPNFLPLDFDLSDGFGPSPPSSSLHNSLPPMNNPIHLQQSQCNNTFPVNHLAHLSQAFPKRNWAQPLLPMGNPATASIDPPNGMSFFQQNHWMPQTGIHQEELGPAAPSDGQQNNLHLIQLPPMQTLPDPEHWCSISYFESDTQLGESFKAPWSMAEVIIDGGMDPAGARAGRFCLGALPNVHRSEASERARLHIGKGIRLRSAHDRTAVYLECLSQKDVFVRCFYLDFEFGLPYGSIVHKICSGTERKVFDLRWAYAEMCGKMEGAQIAAVAQAYAVSGIAPQLASSLECSITGVDELRRVCCTLALSFVKGWGAGYSRTSIKETPCWIEIQLHRPLQLLSTLLSRPFHLNHTNRQAAPDGTL